MCILINQSIKKGLLESNFCLPSWAFDDESAIHELQLINTEGSDGTIRKIEIDPFG